MNGEFLCNRLVKEKQPWFYAAEAAESANTHLALRPAHRCDSSLVARSRRGCGGAVLAFDDGFYFFDFATSRLDLIQHIDPDQPRSRLNDGECDRRRRFLADRMDDHEALKICGLWSVDRDLKVTQLDHGIICSNGSCWSPDDKTFSSGGLPI